MLQLKNISVSFGNNTILNDFSCSVEKGDFIVVLGANGTGKSTLFDTIAGKTKPQQGSIFLENAAITQLSQLQRSSMITRIFQDTELNSAGSLTVWQNLALAHYSRRPARFVNGMTPMQRTQAENILSALGIDSALLDRPMKALSGGQRQLIAFGMSTQLIPKLLLLDEPTAALDPQAATTLLQHAVQFIQKHTITTLLITHDPHIALSVGNKIWVLEKGKLAREYTAEQKKHLSPDALIGQIDYKKLASYSNS